MLPKGVLVVDSQPDSLAVTLQVMNRDMEEIVMKCMTTSAQCISMLSLPGTSAPSLPAELFFVVCCY